MIQEAYPDSVRVVFKHFPQEFGCDGQKAAEAAECAKEQGAVWEYHDLLIDNREDIGDAKLKELAGVLGLDLKRFEGCLDGGVMRQRVERDLREGIALGLRWTPGVYVNGGYVYSQDDPGVSMKRVGEIVEEEVKRVGRGRVLREEESEGEGRQRGQAEDSDDAGLGFEVARGRAEPRMERGKKVTRPVGQVF